MQKNIKSLRLKAINILIEAKRAKSKGLIKSLILSLLIFGSICLSAYKNAAAYDLVVKVKGLRNSKGSLKIALYNKKGSIPDENYKHFYKMSIVEIVNHEASFTFKDLDEGTYAVNILHDENNDGKIDKGFVLPTEGIGFSNFKTINLMNRPSFSRASFILDTNKEIEVKIIYL